MLDARHSLVWAKEDSDFSGSVGTCGLAGGSWHGERDFPLHTCWGWRAGFCLFGTCNTACFWFSLLLTRISL